MASSSPGPEEEDLSLSLSSPSISDRPTILSPVATSTGDAVQETLERPQQRSHIESTDHTDGQHLVDDGTFLETSHNDDTSASSAANDGETMILLPSPPEQQHRHRREVNRIDINLSDIPTHPSSSHDDGPPRPQAYGENPTLNLMSSHGNPFPSDQTIAPNQLVSVANNTSSFSAETSTPRPIQLPSHDTINSVVQSHHKNSPTDNADQERKPTLKPPPVDNHQRSDDNNNVPSTERDRSPDKCSTEKDGPSQDKSSTERGRPTKKKLKKTKRRPTERSPSPNTRFLLNLPNLTAPFDYSTIPHATCDRSGVSSAENIRYTQMPSDDNLYERGRPSHDNFSPRRDESSHDKTKRDGPSHNMSSAERGRLQNRCQEAKRRQPTERSPSPNTRFLLTLHDLIVPHAYRNIPHATKERSDGTSQQDKPEGVVTKRPSHESYHKVIRTTPTPMPSIEDLQEIIEKENVAGSHYAAVDTDRNLQAIGKVNEQAACQTSRQVVGQATGRESEQVTREVTGQAPGQEAIQAAMEVTGQATTRRPTEQGTGQVNSWQSTRQAQSQTTGQVLGQAIEQATVQETRQETEQANVVTQVIGMATRQKTSQAKEHVTLEVTGQATRQATCASPQSRWGGTSNTNIMSQTTGPTNILDRGFFDFNSPTMTEFEGK